MKLVIMGDLHYHDVDPGIPGLLVARNLFYGNLLGRFLQTEGDLHISLGDLTNTGSATELREVSEMLRRRNRTFIHVLGNHDLYTRTKREVLEITGQQQYHMLDAGSSILVFLDTAREMELSNGGGWLDEEQLEWLEAIVLASGTKPVIIFAHHPVHNTTIGSDRVKGSLHPEVPIWNILKQKQGTGIYFNGHAHADSIVTQQNWTFIQVSACLDQPAYRVVELEKNRFQMTTIDVTDAGVVTHIPMLKRHILYYNSNPDARGKDADRQIDISLRPNRRLQKID
ncbi:metallophosphoesterase family protein [Paenibacillus sp. GCM10012307]|uniref:Metallophosphoesterase n=1 Tax=Paenibacillus roseus TaxID=2798579 RepID=A0A934J8B9_9BACL|nr:metallophosphoesterase [Paenibacillus roseus]MBJ6362556.1 metallophosphoesterase [Paenibacillus roseus]